MWWSLVTDGACLHASWDRGLWWTKGKELAAVALADILLGPRAVLQPKSPVYLCCLLGEKKKRRRRTTQEILFCRVRPAANWDRHFVLNSGKRRFWMSICWDGHLRQQCWQLHWASGPALCLLRQLDRSLISAPFCSSFGQVALSSWGRVLFLRAQVDVQAEDSLALVLHQQLLKGTGSSCASCCHQQNPPWLLHHGQTTSLLSPSCRLLMQCLRSDPVLVILTASSGAP